MHAAEPHTRLEALARSVDANEISFGEPGWHGPGVGSGQWGLHLVDVNLDEVRFGELVRVSASSSAG